MNQYKSKSFFKLALRFAIIFLIFVSIFKVGFSIVKNWSFSLMVTQLFSEDKWMIFVKGMIMMSAFYGVFMAGYYKFIKK